MYGNDLGTATLCKSLARVAAEIRNNESDGVPLEELRDDARRLMEGAMVLWERMADECHG